MSEHATQQGSQKSAPRQIIENAMLRVADIRHEYIRAAQRGQAHNPTLRTEFHAAVIDYYFALRPYRNADTLKGKWENVKLWRENGQWVTGFDSLSDWVNRQTVVETETTARGDTTDQHQTTQQLDPKQLLRVSSALDDIAKDLGVGISTNDGARPAGELPQQLNDTNE